MDGQQFLGHVRRQPFELGAREAQLPTEIRDGGQLEVQLQTVGQVVAASAAPEAAGGAPHSPSAVGVSE